MRRCPSYVSLVLSLAVLPPATKAAELPDVTCATIEVRRPKEPPPGGPESALNVTLTNRCGKDITAVDLQYRAASGSTWRIGWEWVVRLAHLEKIEGIDIVRNAKSIEWVDSGPQNNRTEPVSATIKCIVFSDRTAIGDEKRICDMFESRSRHVPRWEEHLKLLDLLPEYYAAGTLLDSLSANPGDNGALDMKSFLVELKNAWMHATSESWPKIIQRRKAIYQRMIAVYREHAERALY